MQAVRIERRGAVRAAHAGPVAGLIAQTLLLAALAGSVGLSGAGWSVGVACAVIVNTALARGLSRHGSERLGPADWVTLTRATLAVAVAALVADSFDEPAEVALLVTLTVVALVLDAVDGWIVRRMGTATPLGAQFDGEVDAFLILVLSVYVARSAGAVGARDRRGALRVPRSRVAVSVDARAASAAPLAQGRRGDAGDRAGDRRRRRPAPGRDPGRPARRTRAALRVVRPRRRVAVDPPLRLARSRGGRCGRRASRRRARTPNADWCERASPRCSRFSPRWSSGSPSSLPTNWAVSRPERSCGSRSRASSSSPWRSCCPPR